MKVEDVLALSNAGFSQDQIIALTKFFGNPDVVNKENVVVEKAQPLATPEPKLEEPKAMPEPEEPKAAEKPNASLDPVLDEIKKLVSTVQQSNISAAQNTVPQKQSTDDILASIIAPQSKL